MVLRRLLSRDKVSAIDRKLEIRKQMAVLWQSSFFDDSIYKPPTTLFDFSRPIDADDASYATSEKHNLYSYKSHLWKLSDDETIGGLSRGKMKFVQPTATTNNKSPESLEEDVTEEKIPPFIRWHGTTNTFVSKKVSPQEGSNLNMSQRRVEVNRSGFCYLRLPEFIFGGANIGDLYNALEITCRSDGRTYLLCLKVESYFNDDIYQGFINIPSSFLTKRDEEIPDYYYPSSETTKDNNEIESTSTDSVAEELETENENAEFQTLILPFQNFVLTTAGREKEIQRKLDGNIRIEHIGLILSDVSL